MIKNMRIKLTKEQELYIIKEYKNGTGKYASELAREFNVHHQVITNCLRRHGVVPTIRIPGGPKMEKSGAWNGGRTVVLGYVYIKSPNHPNKDKRGYVREHRLVMEHKLGRFLKQKEIVHHKNNIKTDNRIENLELYKNNKKHLSSHCSKWKRDEFGRWKK